jgi:hypothetical protein
MAPARVLPVDDPSDIDDPPDIVNIEVASVVERREAVPSAMR